MMGTTSAHTARALDQALALYASDDSANAVLGYHDQVFMITCVLVTYASIYLPVPGSYTLPELAKFEFQNLYFLLGRSWVETHLPWPPDD